MTDDAFERRSPREPLRAALLSRFTADIDRREDAARIDRTANELECRARDLGFVVSADLRVTEAAAATLLCLHRGTVARWRVEGLGPPAYGLPLGRAKVSYKLLDLAIWIERHREKID